MDVVYRVDPGPQVRVGQISMKGADKSDRQVVLANVPLKPGDILFLVGAAFWWMWRRDFQRARRGFL